MASLSEILKSTAESKQQRTQNNKAAREQLSQMRDGALMAITTNPDLYARFLVLQADNIGLSAGNIALALSQMVDPTKIGTTDFWHKQGRYVMDEEMSKGASVFVPPRNQNFRGYLMGSYYDVSQTTGRPMREAEPLVEGSDRMNAAFAALLEAAPVGFIENTGLDVPVRYNERECILEINTEYSTGQVFAALATEISFARLHDRGMNRDYDRSTFQMNAESIGFMVCRRFGVERPQPDATCVPELYENWDVGDRKRALDSIQDMSKQMGRSIDKNIDKDKPRGRAPTYRPTR